MTDYMAELEKLSAMLQNMPKLPFMHVFCHPADEQRMLKLCEPANEMMKVFGIPLTVPSVEACAIMNLEPNAPWTVTKKEVADALVAVVKKVETELDASDQDNIRESIRLLIESMQR